VRLRDLGVPEDALRALATAAARRPELGDTPGADTEAGVREIYAAAW